MKKIVLLIILGILSIIIGASILNKENNKPKKGEVSKKQNAHLLSEEGTVLESPNDKREVLIQVDSSDSSFAYNEITLIYIGAANAQTIDSLKVGDKIRFSYFPDEPTDKQTLNVYIIEKF